MDRHPARRLTVAALVAVCGLAPAGMLGCRQGDGPTTQPASARERQDAAMRDPFNYSTGRDMPDVSGGGIGDFDKEGMNRDVDRVFNP